ncbi:protein MAIN-LIKE 1-like [Glycine soja]|uniref:protein MAIN-LIKE 1-like n=1 Tax=Glycine soja TaxID=3848 RepID=UPI001038E022|nr:protein MAIN-LIKE 1-like [Glycine soja]
MAGGDVHDTRAYTLADTGAQAAEDEPEGFSSDPRDPSVLTEIASRPVPTIEGLVAGTGLSPLIAGSIDTSDRGLLPLFVERWQRETSSFDLPVGEVMITLDDVASLLHLPVVGDLHAFQPVHVDDVVQMPVELLMVPAKAARVETTQCRGPYVRLQWVRDIYERRCQAGHWKPAARVFLLHLLDCTLFANKSVTNVHVVFLEALRDLSQAGRYAWGVVVLYWIYEHFPSVAESTVDPDYDEDSPRACRWIATKKTVKSIRTPTYREHLDRLWILDVRWIPYGEHRPVRDFHMIPCYFGLLRWGPVVVYY